MARGRSILAHPRRRSMARTNINRQIWPIVVGHRGASATYPENTLASFEGAIAAGADVIELDVRVTADGEAVIMHDLDVSITTEGTGFVHELTLAQIKALDASGGRGARAEVPTFREALEAISGRAGVNAEIKNLPGEPAFDYPREAADGAVVPVPGPSSLRGPALGPSVSVVAF